MTCTNIQQSKSWFILGIQIVRSCIWCSKKGPRNVIVPEYVTRGVWLWKSRNGSLDMYMISTSRDRLVTQKWRVDRWDSNCMWFSGETQENKILQTWGSPCICQDLAKRLNSTLWTPRVNFHENVTVSLPSFRFWYIQIGAQSEQWFAIIFVMDRKLT
jgi:hypothetical protein